MIELKSISKKFIANIFEDFSYTFKKNNIYFLSGINGSGKTTLLKLIKGIYLCDRGEIIFDYNLKQKNDVAFIDGNFRTFFHRLTVYQNLQYFHSLQSKNNCFESIDNLLSLFNVSILRDKVFSSLSQGQMQLVSIIRGFSSNPKVILLDEVFSSLDIENKKMVMKYISEYVLNEGAVIIFTSHEDNHDEIIFKELSLS
tara:strand:+ start:354 stop:950 length:597 start_codon:yes stop_codon:yes gene_type:complete